MAADPPPGFFFSQRGAPPPRDCRYFEVRVASLAENAALAFGVAPASFRLESGLCVGLVPRSVALAASGRLVTLGGDEDDTPLLVTRPVREGDIVGCGVNSRGQVFFTRNGFYYGVPLPELSVDGAEDDLLPTVSADSKATRVEFLARPAWRYAPRHLVVPDRVANAFPREELASMLKSENELRRCDEIQHLYDEAGPMPPPTIEQNIQRRVLVEHGWDPDAMLPVYHGTNFLYHADPEMSKLIMWMWADVTRRGDLRIGDAAPDAALVTLDGRPTRLHAFIKPGRPLILVGGSHS